MAVTSVLVLMSVQHIAVHWWQGQAHPYYRPFPCDDFAAFLVKLLGMKLRALESDNDANERFSELVGWKG